jgi:hypothetical protein
VRRLVPQLRAAQAPRIPNRSLNTQRLRKETQ